ncbi:hypothetical protein OWR29_36550 [Actinoplanes sp. Pm04-4]|uniref:Uncharacterized protein n=1 Tax=Paractinoplanes pyxinae TaxID=2997416 RepID=A0ABT4BAJ4_9ACTN|nr:hypothetical protein [Actinoplanes pyxinae]MCY1143542.1 hypothetical protein [Actinoplanes pyxinae]
MRMRRSVSAVALVAAVAVSAVPVTAGAAFAKPAASKPAQSKPGKPAKPAKVSFAATGSVTAVDLGSSTVTVAVKSGTKDVKGRTVSISVPASARIVVNGGGRTLGAVSAGFRITVTGSHVGSLYTAAKIQAHGVRATPAPAPSPSVTPAPAPSTGPDDSATPDDDVDPTLAAQ